MSKYKVIQLTNSNIGAITAGSFLPLGSVTRRINASCDCDSIYTVSSSTNDSVIISEPGYYKVTYSASLTAGAEGVVSVSLLTNSTSVYTVSENALAADDIVDLTLVYIIRVCPNCCSTPTNCPVTVQIALGDVATSGTSTANLIIERVY